MFFGAVSASLWPGVVCFGAVSVFPFGGLVCSLFSLLVPSLSRHFGSSSFEYIQCSYLSKKK